MGLISKTVKVGLMGGNAEYYEKLGYSIPRKINKYGKLTIPRGTKIEVNIKDLPKNSTAKVKVKCDYCNNEKEVAYQSYCLHNHEGKCYCKSCSNSVLNIGENNPNWNTNKTQQDREEDRKNLEYDSFIKRVLARDDYKCVVCGESHQDLNVHHLDGYNWCKEKRTDDTNGVTLCKKCHKNFHSIYGYGNNTKEQFKEWFSSFEKQENYIGEIPTAKKVYVYEDNMIFDNARECAKYLNCNNSKIYDVCNMKKGCFTVNKKHIFWLKDFENFSKEEKEYHINKQSSRYKRVVCINTMKIYNKIEDVKYDYPLICTQNISKCCKGKIKSCGKDNNGNPLIWEYYE